MFFLSHSISLFSCSFKLLFFCFSSFILFSIFLSVSYCPRKVSSCFFLKLLRPSVYCFHLCFFSYSFPLVSLFAYPLLTLFLYLRLRIVLFLSPSRLSISLFFYSFMLLVLLFFFIFLIRLPLLAFYIKISEGQSSSYCFKLLIQSLHPPFILCILRLSLFLPQLSPKVN